MGKRPARNKDRAGHRKGKSKQKKQKHQQAQGHGGRQKPNFTPVPKRNRFEVQQPDQLGAWTRIGLVVGGTVYTIWAVGNDITGVGAADDWTIPISVSMVVIGVNGEREAQELEPQKDLGT